MSSTCATPGTFPLRTVPLSMPLRVGGLPRMAVTTRFAGAARAGVSSRVAVRCAAGAHARSRLPARTRKTKLTGSRIVHLSPRRAQRTSAGALRRGYGLPNRQAEEAPSVVCEHSRLLALGQLLVGNGLL